ASKRSMRTPWAGAIPISAITSDARSPNHEPDSGGFGPALGKGARLYALPASKPPATAPSTFVAPGQSGQVNAQASVQPSRSSPLRPSSHSSPASSVPLPQPAGTQSPSKQMRSSPHVVRSASGAPATQAWVVGSHVSAPLHGAASSHIASLVHVEAHVVGSHPSNASPLPSTHCSPEAPSTIPSPHTLGAHAPATQTRPSPHDAPSPAVLQSTAPPSAPVSGPSHAEAKVSARTAAGTMLFMLGLDSRVRASAPIHGVSTRGPVFENTR